MALDSDHMSLFESFRFMSLTSFPMQGCPGMH